MQAKQVIAVARSLHSISNLSGTNLQTISLACTGTYVSAYGLYFRHLHPDILVGTSDLGTLKLQDYDKSCGVERKYHSIKEMARKKNSTTKD